MKAHIIDTDILMTLPAKAWVIDKDNPNIPIMKLDRHQLSIISSGLYRKQNNRIDFDGRTYFLPDDMMDTLIHKCKKSNSDPTKLALSIQEFLNPELMALLEPTFDLTILNHIRNTPDHIYLICSSNTKESTGPHIETLVEKIKDYGLNVTDIYYLTESWKKKDDDKVAYNKIRLAVQHLTGLKASGDGLSDTEINTYRQVELYDTSTLVIETGKKVNDILFHMTEMSEKNMIPIIKQKVRARDLILSLNRWTGNRMNKIEKTLVPVSYSNIASFEGFTYRTKDI